MYVTIISWEVAQNKPTNPAANHILVSLQSGYHCLFSILSEFIGFERHKTSWCLIYSDCKMNIKL